MISLINTKLYNYNLLAQIISIRNYLELSD